MQTKGKCRAVRPLVAKNKGYPLCTLLSPCILSKAFPSALAADPAACCTRARTRTRRRGSAALAPEARHRDPTRSRDARARYAFDLEFGIGAPPAGRSELAVKLVLGQATDAGRVAVAMAVAV